nr:helix-turn-helix transcriptional regulator [Elizabethkingia sp. ASV34]
MKENLNNQIGYYIKKELESKGITPKQLEQDLEVSQPYISALLNGKKSIGKRIAKKLNELYGLSESIMLTGNFDEIDDEISPSISNNSDNHPVKNKTTDTKQFEDLPINKQLEILHKENKILKREVDRMSLMMEIYFSTLMAHFDIDSPDEQGKEIKPKPKSKAN